MTKPETDIVNSAKLLGPVTFHATNNGMNNEVTVYCGNSVSFSANLPKNSVSCGPFNDALAVAKYMVACSPFAILQAFDPVVAETPVPKQPEVKPYYIHFNGHSVYVKDADLFEQQGGHTDNWGTGWHQVAATSLEHARSIGMLWVRNGGFPPDKTEPQSKPEPQEEELAGLSEMVKAAVHNLSSEDIWLLQTMLLSIKGLSFGFEQAFHFANASLENVNGDIENSSPQDQVDDEISAMSADHNQ